MTISNMSIADRAAVLKDQIDVLQKEYDAIASEVKASGVEEVIGEFATIKVALAERTTVSTAAVKAILTDDQFKAVTKTAVYSVMRIERTRTV